MGKEVQTDVWDRAKAAKDELNKKVTGYLIAKR